MGYFGGLHFPVAASTGMVIKLNKLPPWRMQSGKSAAETPSARRSRLCPPLSCSFAISESVFCRGWLFIE